MQINERIKVLILGVGGNVSQGIIKAIKNSDLDVELVGACIAPDSLGLYMCDRAYIAPYANDESFMEWLIELCNKEEIDIVLTGVEENICAIQEHLAMFKEGTKAVFIASDYDKLMIGQDKYRTCEWLKENGCNYPKFCKMEDVEAVQQLVTEVGFPIVAKPRNGKSSNGVFVLRNWQEYEVIRDRKDYVLEEYIGDAGTEYTVGCYCDKEGTLRDIIIMHRMLKDGSTAWAKVVENEAIRAEVVKICNAFKPRGPLNVQLRLNKEGVPVCFELNVRFSGTTPIRAHFGYRDVEAMIREFVLEEDIDACFHVEYGEVFRYVNEMYVDCNATDNLKKYGLDTDIKSKNMCLEVMKRRS